MQNLKQHPICTIDSTTTQSATAAAPGRRPYNREDLPNRIEARDRGQQQRSHTCKPASRTLSWMRCTTACVTPARTVSATRCGCSLPLSCKAGECIAQ